MPVIGSAAPDFALKDKDDRTITLSEFKGKTVVLYFYPRDNTPGCSRQACAFAGAYEEFKTLDVVVIGISKVSAASHRKFAEKYSLPFILLSDPDRKVTEAYGVWQAKDKAGTMGVVRTTYLIDENGTIAKAFGKVKAAENPAQMLEEV